MSNLSLDTIDIHTKELYVDRGYPWEEWDLLRSEAPIFWYEREGMDPFWAMPIARSEGILAMISFNSFSVAEVRNSGPRFDQSVLTR